MSEINFETKIFVVKKEKDTSHFSIHINMRMMYPIRVCPFFLSCLLSPKFLNMYIFAEESRERKRRKSVFFFFIKKNYFVCVFLVHLSLFFFSFLGLHCHFLFPMPIRMNVCHADAWADYSVFILPFLSFFLNAPI